MNTMRYFKLGLFMLLTFGALVAGAIALGAGRMFEKSIDVQTCFDQSIAGLEVGAPVKHRGVTVGHVQSIRFPRDQATTGDTSSQPFRYILVDMAIDPHVVADINERHLKAVLDRMVADGLRARISQSGLAGSAYIDLNYLDPKRYPITTVPIRTENLFVPSAPGGLNQVVDALTDITTKLQKADLDQVVRHVDSLILHVDQSVQDLQVAEMRKAFAEFAAKKPAMAKAQPPAQAPAAAVVLAYKPGKKVMARASLKVSRQRQAVAAAR